MIMRYVSLIVTAIVFPVLPTNAPYENATKIYKTSLNDVNVTEISKVAAPIPVVVAPPSPPPIPVAVVATIVKPPTVIKIQKPAPVKYVCRKGEHMWHSHHTKYRIRRTC